MCSPQGDATTPTYKNRGVRQAPQSRETNKLAHSIWSVIVGLAFTINKSTVSPFCLVDFTAHVKSHIL